MYNMILKYISEFFRLFSVAFFPVSIQRFRIILGVVKRNPLFLHEI